MKIVTKDSVCSISIESDDASQDYYNLAKFTFELMEMKIEKVILHYVSPRYFSLFSPYDLLFQAISNNPCITCFSIQGPFTIRPKIFEILKNKNITLELKYGVLAKIKDVIQFVQDFKVTHLEFNDVIEGHYPQSSISEEQLLILCDALNKQPKLFSLILPLPDRYSKELILKLSHLRSNTEITKFGFSTLCDVEDILTIIAKHRNIANLGFRGIHKLEQRGKDLFKAIKDNLKLTHFTLHAWPESASQSLIDGLSQLPYLESILLNCQEDEKFVMKIPDLVCNNLNVKSIELLHESDEIEQNLQRETITYPRLYNMAALTPSLMKFQVAKIISSKEFVFGDNKMGINLINPQSYLHYGNSKFFESNQIINDLSHPDQQKYLDHYLKGNPSTFKEAIVKPINWGQQRMPSLYVLCLQKSFRFFKENPHQMNAWQTLPDTVKKDFIRYSK